MKGTWKENVGGYTKDNKRKKQSRKHTLKDCAKWHISHTDSYREGKESPSTILNGDVEIQGKTIPAKKQWIINIYSIDVDNYNYKEKTPDDVFEGFFEGNNRVAYEYHGKFYDIYDNSEIQGKIKILNLIDTEYIDWDKDLPDIKERVWKPATKTTIFLYGKPLPADYWNMFGFYSSRARKYWQKAVNKMDRQRVREYISNEDWDIDVKTHALSKSIDWEIW
jgi:hypothetical protein